MARKKIEPIKSLGSNIDKLIVQKSQPLFALWQSDLTLAEFKIMDTYLARIDSHKPEKRLVVLEKGELEKLLGVQKINLLDLKERLKHLMSSVVEVPDSTMKKGVRFITLFEEAVAEQDNCGLWQVKLECTQKAMKYFFNIENLGYFRYKLRCITSIASRHTYIMFIYLEANRFRRSWEISLEELKVILNCEQEEYAKEFKYFNRDVLKKVQRDLFEITDCRYSYEPIKKGRSIVGIRFTLETLPKIEVVDSNQYTLEDWQKEEKQNKRDKICNGFSSDEFNGFSNEELELLKDIAWSKKDEEQVQKHHEVLNDFHMACQFATADYLRVKIKMAKLKKPKNLFLYVKKMIENDKN